MASEMKGTTISLTRGDSLTVKIELFNSADEPYIPAEGDSIRFALKHTDMKFDRSDYKDPEPLIIKNIPTDTLTLDLAPEDTKDLPFNTYVYDIEMTFANGRVDTFIQNSKFILTPEVH